MGWNRWKKRKGKLTLKALAQDVRKIQRNDAPELKVINTSPALSATMTNTGSVFLMNFIAQGTDQGQRISNKIRVRYIQFNYSIQMAVAGVVANCRVLIVKDTDQLGTAPVGADILGATGAVSAPLSDLNVTNHITKRFHVLYDKLHSLSTAGDSNEGRLCRVKVNDFCYYYANTAGSALRNAIYALFITDQVPAVQPVYSFVQNVYYTDA